MNVDKIRDSLNQGLSLINPATAKRLEEARNNALSHYGARRTVRAMAFAGHARPHPHLPRLGVWLPLLALILGLAAISYWQHFEQASQNGDDDDTAILADDLPVPAFTDQRFDAWLKRSQP